MGGWTLGVVRRPLGIASLSRRRLDRPSLGASGPWLRIGPRPLALKFVARSRCLAQLEDGCAYPSNTRAKNISKKVLRCDCGSIGCQNVLYETGFESGGTRVRKKENDLLTAPFVLIM
jgi:hypothetical protein